MTVVPFGELKPDLPASRNDGLIAAQNALPLGIGYKEVKGPSVVTDALTARCRHFVSYNNDSNVWFTYAGDATKLYFSTGTAFTGSGTYNLTTEDNWESARWDTVAIFCCITDEMVEDTVGAGSFATFMTSSLKPKAHHIAVIGDHLVLGDINDGTVKRNGVIWSALGDYTDFDPSAAKLAGSQQLRGNGGIVNKVIGGRTGLVFQENAIWRMTPAGPPLKFRFDRIADTIGALAKGGVVKTQDNIFFLSEDGFYLLNEPTGQLKPIGKNRVDNTVLGLIDKTALHRVSTTVDEFGIVYFSFTSGGGNPEQFYVYNPFQDRWGMGELNHEIIGLYRGGATNDIDSSPLDTRNIDTDPYLIDSAEFRGGAPSVSIFDNAHKLATLEGNALEAVLETGDVVFEDGKRAFVNKVRPIIEGQDATVTCSVGTRELTSEATSYGGASTVNARGDCSLRASGRYMRFKTSITGGFDDAVGIEVDPKMKGRQ